MIKFTKIDVEVKSQLFQNCQEFVESRLQTVQNTIAEIQESLMSETKSSAGDKHETGRAMLQLELEKAGHQLSEVEKLKETLSKIDIHKVSKTVGLGSIVLTSNSNYFISISAGEFIIDGTNYFAISPSTPIGLLLMGKNVGDEVVFREQSFNIKKIR